MKLLILISTLILSISAQAKISQHEAREIIEHVLGDYQKEISEKNITIGFEFSNKTKLPSAYAKWVKPKKIGQITVSNKLL